ncbi:MAG TPA: tetratricopeptide repeat protein [Nostocaceae cyanobacterium]|nr:tetratricopeptide repeat protein [Nostocaceae cyanobacterium]
MLEQVVAAFEKKDYQTAAKLIQQLLKESPDNPWVQFYLGRLYEVSNKRLEAEKIYRQLLLLTTHPKILIQTRQGLKRLEEIKQEEKQRAIAQATAEPINGELGALILEPMSNEIKATAAKQFAQIMQLDAYTARLIMPSRGWRLHRTGAVGELQFYATQLQQAGIPCFCVRVPQIQRIQVFQVKYFSQSHPQATVICANEDNQVGHLTFNWSEVSARVEGLLPIFEKVVDINARRKLQRKTQTQDYAHFWDLHLPARHSILRLYDNGYQFQQGLEIVANASQNTVRINWNRLIEWIKAKIPQAKVWSDFPPFAETVLDQTDLLAQISAQIPILRQEKTHWDAAFHLYSGCILTKSD